MPKRYDVSKSISLHLLVRAYELWCSTDMSQREVAKVLNVHHRTLNQAITKAERRGLYGQYLPKSTTKIVTELVTNSPDSLTTEDIQHLTNLSPDVAKQATYRAYRQGFIRRRKLSNKQGYIYF